MSKKSLFLRVRNKYIGEIVISLILIALLVFFINPLDLLMPQPMHMVMVPLLVILFIAFAGFLWKEKAGDERENLHRFIAARFAYFAGVTTVIIGIILQSSHQVIDPWLIITICVMLLAKILGLIYSNLKH